MLCAPRLPAAATIWSRYRERTSANVIGSLYSSMPQGRCLPSDLHASVFRIGLTLAAPCTIVTDWASGESHGTLTTQLRTDPGGRGALHPAQQAGRPPGAH